jgi:hypothetical protein
MMSNQLQNLCLVKKDGHDPVIIHNPIIHQQKEPPPLHINQAFGRDVGSCGERRVGGFPPRLIVEYEHRSLWLSTAETSVNPSLGNPRYDVVPRCDELQELLV